jgi:hypothetical protein
MTTRKRPRRDVPRAKNRVVRPGRKPDNLSAANARQFRAWLGRVREHWEAHGRPWLGTLLERAPCRKRADGTKEEELPERDRDWFMRAQNTNLPLSRKKAIEICLRLRRHNFRVNDNIARMLLDDARDEVPIFLLEGAATALADYLVDGLERRSSSISEIGRSFLLDYLSRYEALTLRDPCLSQAVWQFVSEHRITGWWQLSRSPDFHGIDTQQFDAERRASEPSSASASADPTEPPQGELTTLAGPQRRVTEPRGPSVHIDAPPNEARRFTALTLFMRVEQETRGMKFDVRTPRKKRSGSK